MKAQFANQNDQLSSFHQVKRESAPEKYNIPLDHAHKFAINDFLFWLVSEKFCIIIMPLTDISSITMTTE